MPQILIIDDDDLFRTLLVDMLTFEGYQTIEAKDGNMGVDLFKKEHPDLVITDILMPEKEGMQTIREIKKESSDAHIIALSGATTRPDGISYLQLATDLGANRAFAKPFKTAEFLGAVAELV